MITAKFKENGLYREIKIVGHAQYAPRGYDIVCSSVSILSIAVFNELNDLLPIVIEESEGKLVCSFRLLEVDSSPELLYKMLKKNIIKIADKYKTYVETSIEVLKT